MVIANPIYDVVFKFLMEDERIAKFFIGTMLDEMVEDVTMIPDDRLLRDENGVGFMVLRRSFDVQVRTADGLSKRLLVQILKPRDQMDLFRLLDHLRTHSEDRLRQGDLPILTIYLIPFTINELQTSVVKINGQCTDLISRQLIFQKSEFIEKLSHDCYVVQLRRIKGPVRTKLEKLLSVFEQAYFVDEYGIIKEYHHQTNDEEVQRILEKLHYAGTEPSERKKIEDEQEAYRVMEVFLQAKTEKMEAKARKMEEKIQQQKQSLAEKDSALAARDKALEENAKLIEELKRKLEGK